MKKALRGDANTARWLYSKAEPKIFAPPQGAQDGQNLIGWRWSLYFHIQTQFGEDRFKQFRVIVVTDPQTNKPTNKHTNRQDRLQYTTPLSLARSVIID